jgi:hypothetical protein
MVRMKLKITEEFGVLLNRELLVLPMDMQCLKQDD